MSFEIPITLKEVEKRTGWSRFKILRLRTESGFPDPLPCGGYLWSEIENWQFKLKEERDAKSNADVNKKKAAYVELKIQLHALGKQLKNAGVNVNALN